jgi:hypothetical protein
MKHDSEEFHVEFNRSVEAGRKAFELLVDETEGRGGRMVLAISSILASMEAQYPGTIDDISKGASLMLDRLAEAMTGQAVADVLERIGRSKH